MRSSQWLGTQTVCRSRKSLVCTLKKDMATPTWRRCGGRCKLRHCLRVGKNTSGDGWSACVPECWRGLSNHCAESYPLSMSRPAYAACETSSPLDPFLSALSHNQKRRLPFLVYDDAST